MKEKEKKRNPVMVAWTYMEKKPQVVLLFAMLVVGIMASWFWPVGWDYLHAPACGLLPGSPTSYTLRPIVGKGLEYGSDRFSPS